MSTFGKRPRPAARHAILGRLNPERALGPPHRGPRQRRRGHCGLAFLCRLGPVNQQVEQKIGRILKRAGCLPSVTLDTLRRAASAVGRTLRVELT
jgi:hypothetical protein